MQRVTWLALLAGIGFQAHAAGGASPGGTSLNPQTAKAWEEYVGSVRAQNQARLGPTACFLWAQEQPGGMARLKAGEILAGPADGHTPHRVPGGLIHHWIGAVFLPGATLQEVMAALRDYTRYSQYYPSVVSSRLVTRDGLTDNFTTLERHQAMFSKIGLDADLITTYANAGERRAFSVSSTTRLRQVQNFGNRERHELEPFSPEAYVWSLSTISRFWEHDGGVYLELEAMALSRDIPFALRWLVDPFVRQAAEDTLIASLKQTRQAILGSRSVNAGRPPAGAMTFTGR